MTSLRNLLRYLWDGLGGQMAEFSITVSGKIPAQITLALILAALTGSITLATLCGREEVRAPPAHATPTPLARVVGGSLGGGIGEPLDVGLL